MTQELMRVPERIANLTLRELIDRAIWFDDTYETYLALLDWANQNSDFFGYPLGGSDLGKVILAKLKELKRERSHNQSS